MKWAAGSDRGPIKVSRRMVLACGASALAAPFLIRQAIAQASGTTGWWEQIDAARALIGDANPHPSGLTIEMPSISGDGASVPITLIVDGLTTPERYVESIHCFATAHRRPAIADFHLSPRCGRAEPTIAGRL